MKRRIPTLLLVLALVACAAIRLAACNEGGKDGGGAGDRIFTEDASLAEIVSALENAESLTYSAEYHEVGTYKGEDYQLNITAQYRATEEGCIYENSSSEIIGAKTVDSSSCYDCKYRLDGVDYSIIFGDVGFVSDDYAYKNLAQYDSDKHKVTVVAVGQTLSGYVTADPNGNLMVTEDTLIEGTDYVKLNGTSIEIGWDVKYSDEEYDAIKKHKLVWSGVNATTIEIPAEVKAMESQAVWADYVDYNGVDYFKAEDEYGEYYIAYPIQDGVVPEKTINGLSVREGWSE